MEDHCEESECGADVERFQDDTLTTCKMESPVPSVALEQECFMGIDEAGRGPVLGQCVAVDMYSGCEGVFMCRSYGVRHCLLSDLYAGGGKEAWNCRPLKR